MYRRALTAFVYTPLFVLSLVIAGCGESVEQPVQQKPRLRFAQLPISDSAVTQLALLRGFIKESGLDYIAISVPAGPDEVTALRTSGVAGADAGGIAITPVVTMIGAKDDPVVIASTLRSQYSAQLVTFDSTGITDNPSSLRGKRIGVVRNTVGDIYLYKLLKKGGLSEKDIVLVNGRPPELRALLIRGDLDAAILWDPFLRQAVKGYRKGLADKTATSRGEPRILVDPTLHTQIFNVVTTRSKLTKKREALTGFLRALIQAERYVNENKVDAQTQLEAWLNLEKGDLADVFAKTEYRVSLDVPYIKEHLRDQLQWLRVPRPDAFVPDNLSTYVDASLLKAVDAGRVVE
ncbi:MAG: ABC transporter substrate-binding protein [bacterium]